VTRYGAAVDDGRPPGFHEKRRDILTGAARVFERRGFSAGTTKEIAAEVGLSQPAIYHYVGSKEDLLGEIAMQVSRDMTSALETGLAAGETSREQFRAVIREFAAAVIRNQAEFAVFWKELHAIPEAARTAVLADERKFLNRIGSLVKELQGTGELPSDAPTPVVTEAIIGMVCWTYHWYRPGRSPDADQVAQVFCDLLRLS
jgi:AcrR family transcriptional regulator